MARLACHFNGTPVLFNHPPGDGQSQAGPPRLGGEEGLKNAPPCFGGDARPGILYDNGQPGIIGIQANRQRALPGHSLDCIEYQVSHRLFEALPIGAHRRQCRRIAAVDVDCLSLNALLVTASHVLYYIGDCLAAKFKLKRAGYAQNIFQDAIDAPNLAHNHGHTFFLR